MSPRFAPMPEWSNVIRALLAGMLTMAPAVVAAAAPRDEETVQSCLRLLRRSVTAQRDGSHLLLLSALRQLEDPALAPVYRRHATSSDPGIQVHAALGLAEVDEPREVMPSVVLSLPTPEARAIVVERAVNGDLISEPRVLELLAAPDLEPLPRLWLLARLHQDGRPMDESILVRLAENADIDIAGLAVWLLHEHGHDSMLSGYQKRIAALARAARHRHLQEIFAAIDAYELRAALPWVLESLADPELPTEVRFEGVRAALSLDLAEGLAAWNTALGDDPSPAHAVRCAMLLAMTGKAISPSTLARLPTGDPHVERLVAVARARADAPADLVRALIDLVDVGHALSAAWALEASTDLPPADAATVYAHAIRAVEGDRAGRAARAERAVIASTRLLEIDPDAAVALLLSVEDDSLTQETMLIGFMASDSARAGEAAATLPRVGTGHADSITLLLIARHAAALAADDLTNLGTIAAGGGRVSQALQAQAAWLYLRHTSATSEAVAELTSLD